MIKWVNRDGLWSISGRPGGIHPNGLIVADIVPGSAQGFRIFTHQSLSELREFANPWSFPRGP